MTTRPLPLALGRLKKTILSPITKVDVDDYRLDSSQTLPGFAVPQMSKPRPSPARIASEDTAVAKPKTVLPPMPKLPVPIASPSAPVKQQQETKVPEVNLPEVKLPEIKLPEVNVPELFTRPNFFADASPLRSTDLAQRPEQKKPKESPTTQASARQAAEAAKQASAKAEARRRQEEENRKRKAEEAKLALKEDIDRKQRESEERKAAAARLGEERRAAEAKRAEARKAEAEAKRQQAEAMKAAAEKKRREAEERRAVEAEALRRKAEERKQQVQQAAQQKRSEESKPKAAVSRNVASTPPAALNFGFPQFGSSLSKPAAKAPAGMPTIVAWRQRRDGKSLTIQSSSTSFPYLTFFLNRRDYWPNIWIFQLRGWITSRDFPHSQR